MHHGILRTSQFTDCNKIEQLHSFVTFICPRLKQSCNVNVSTHYYQTNLDNTILHLFHVRLDGWMFNDQ